MIYKELWFFYSMIAFVLWGIWGFFSKLANLYLSPASVYLYGSAGALAVTLFSVLFLGFRFAMHPVGLTYALIAGISGGAGVVFFYFAMKDGKASIVVALTALYPLLTLLLSFIILREQLTLKQTVGIFLSVLAMLLIST